MKQKLTHKKILIIATDGYEQSELEVPLTALKEQGALVHLASPGRRPIMGWKDRNWGATVPVDYDIEAVSMADYDALVIPGGVINPDKLRTDKHAVQLVRDAVTEGKVVAAICHGVWLLVEADVVRGLQLTSYSSIKTDVENAGGHWVDKSVVTEKGIVTSRKPDDLEDFVKKIVEEVQEGLHLERRVAS